MLAEYLTYYCPVHKKLIFYFKSDSWIQGKWHCWDCIAEKKSWDDFYRKTTEHNKDG